MAESKNNVITRGLSGKIGDMIVFSNRHGKTIVSNKPKERSGVQSEVQKAHKAKFQQAVIYAKAAIKDPATMQGYKDKAKDGVMPYNVAVADFFHAPDFQSVELNAYTGKIGDTIKVRVSDGFKVKEVSVTILNADGTEVEKGNAVQIAETDDWIFTAKKANASLDGDKIVIRASDVPGNISEKEEVFS
jgi:hypothetical protein